MRGEVITQTGKTITLPELTAYRLLHSDGSAADSFELTFPTEKSLLPSLRLHRELRCIEGEEVVFRGVVDEAEAVCGDAFTTTLCGRGLAAKLMDNQADGADFYTLDLGTVLERYVRPCGIDKISVEGGPWRMQFASVGTGCSCQRILQGFCLHAGAPRPRFTPDGTLLISARAGHYAIKEADILSARWRFCRYGVISRQKVVDLTARTARIAEDPRLGLLDIHAEQVATRSGPFTHLTERTAQQRLAQSAENLDTLELVLPGAFPARPCDGVTVSLPSMEAAGEYIITETCRSFDGRREITQLSLRAKEI